MLRFDYRDITVGILLAGGGIAFAWYALANYELGTVRRMGPGMFPFALGVVQVVLGAVIAIGGLLRSGHVPDLRFWTPLFVFGGIIAFGLLVRPFGLIPAVVALVIISAFAQLTFKPLTLLFLALAAAGMTWGIFHAALGLPMPLFAGF